MFHRTREFASAPIGHPAPETASPPASFDFYTSYCATISKVYGADKCPTRKRWDAMSKAPCKARKLTDAEFDYSQFSEENGDGPIY